VTIAKEDRRTRGRITVGTYSYLSTGRWPKGASYVGKTLKGLRRDLERAVNERGTKVEEWAACLIQSACRHEARAQLLQRKLRLETLTPDQYFACLRDISAATDSRDRCVKALGLDVQLQPLSVDHCPQCRQHYLQCVCPVEPTNVRAIAEDDAQQAISASDGQLPAEPEDRGSALPNSQSSPSSPADADAGRSSSPPAASASTASQMPAGPADNAATGQGATGKAIAEDDRDEQPDDETPF
jgi:hypothetical protein